MSNFFDDYQPEPTADEKAEAAIKEREEFKRRQLQLDLITSDAGKKQLVEELKKALPIGGHIFVGNSSIYKNASLADITLERLAEIKKALTLEIEENGKIEKQYTTGDIAAVLLSWLFDVDINDLQRN